MPKGFFSLSCSGSIICARYFQYSDWIFFWVALRYFRNDVQSVSLWYFFALLYSRCFLFIIFLMSLLIQGSEYRLEEYLKGMNWFMISWRLCLKRSQSGSGESVSGAWF